MARPEFFDAMALFAVPPRSLLQFALFFAAGIVKMWYILTPTCIRTTPCLLFLFLTSIFQCIRAQEAPSLSVEMFDYTTSFRQSVCERQAQLDNETIQLRNALRGLELSTWLYMDNRYVQFVESDNETFVLDPNDPGLIGVLLDEVAIRGGFSWRSSFGVVDNITLPEGKSFTDLVVWSTWAFDISAAYWAKSLQRMDRGVSFPEGWYDGSIIMVSVEPEASGSSNLDLWSFLEPFTTGVWIMILVTIVVSALVYWFLDWYDTESDEMRLGNKPGQNLFLTAITFTGQFEFKPSSNAARIFTASLAFWSLIVMSAYTANLASFLVVQNTPTVTITTVGDAVRNNYQMCVMENTNTEETVRRLYPGAQIVRSPSEADTYRQLREGICDIALNAISSWEEYRTKREVNGDCRMTWLGREFYEGEGGFATRSDSGTLCTSLVRDVLNLHLLEMKETGFVDRAWDDHLHKHATVDCDATASSVEEEESDGQLSLQAMGGTFIIHYIATAFAILLAVAAKVYHNKSVCKRPLSHEPELSSSNKRAERVEKSPNSTDDGVCALDSGTGFSERDSHRELHVLILEQNTKLAALSRQNAELVQMMTAMKSGSSHGHSLQTGPVDDA